MARSILTAVVGEMLALSGTTLKVVSTTTGCKDFIFQSEAGARFCKYSVFCFAHNRNDRASVKFVKV